MDGGRFGLLGVVRYHRGAVEYDLRSRFGLSLADVGARVTITEASRLVTLLASDPSSQVGAALMGLDYPVSREQIVLMDLYDLTAQVNSDPKKPKPKPYPRPLKSTDTRVAKPDVPQEVVLAALREAGHTNLPAA